MTPTLLQTVFRRVSRLAADPTATDGSDADLLRRFADTQDESAFLALLDRHGPLAWAVCRQMLPDPADAEDAFQATFLALVQSAKKLGRVKSVGGWLHGVAVRVCLKVRRSAVRRKQREERAAKPEGVAGGEPEWDTLHAAVHEEIYRLPAVLRAVFVLCELEGVRQPDAAVRLGCKLGTVSGRLARARQALLKALTARGLAPVVAVGMIAVGGTTTALSPTLLEKALATARSGHDIGLTVPSGVIQLAKSVSEGAFMKTKLMVAATLAVAGLMLTATGRWTPTADAQDPPAAEPPARTPRPSRPAPVDPQDPPPPPVRPSRPAELPQPPRPAEPPRPIRNFDPDDPRQPSRPADPARPGRPAEPRDPQPMPPGPDRPGLAPRGPQQRMEHELFDVPTSKDELSKLIKKQESTGWEFAGQVDMGKGAQLVFKRPKGNPPGMGWGVPMTPQPPRGEPQPRRGQPDDAPMPPRGVPQPPRGEPRDLLPRRGDDIPPPAPQPQPRRERGGDRLPAEEPVPPTDFAPIPSPTPISTPFPTPDPLPANRTDSIPPALLVPSEGIPTPTVPVILPVKVEDGEVHVIELKHASPASISKHVKTFFEVQVNEDEDTGSLVVRCNKKTLAEIEKLVEKLDKPSKRGGGA